MSDSKDVPLHHRRATGDVRRGTSSTPVAESSNPAVKRFARGGRVENDMEKKVPAPKKHGDESAAMKMAAKGRSAKDEVKDDFHAGEDHKMKRGGKAKHKYAKGGEISKSKEGRAVVGADSAKDMRGGSLPDGDEFKRGGAVKFAKGGSVTCGVSKW